MAAKPSSGTMDYGAVEVVPVKRPGNSTALTAAIIVADVVGAGILSMALAVSRLGWLLGTTAILALLAMNVHTSILLWRVSMVFPEACTLVDLTRAAFQLAAPWAQRWAVNGVGVMQQVFLFLTLCLYTLSIGKAFGMFFHDVHLCLPVWTLAGVALLLPMLATGRNLGSWHPLIWVNCLTIIGTVLVPLGYFASQGVAETRPPGSHFSAAEGGISVGGTLASLSSFAFAFSGQFIVVEIISEMRDPAEFPKAYVNFSAPFQGAAFLLVGLGGYYYKGSAAIGMIVDNMPFGGWFQLAVLFLATHMLITYLVKGVVVCRALHEVLGHGHVDDPSAEGWSQWCAIVVSVLALSLLCSQVVPFFSDLVDLLGASLVPLCCWVMPIVLYARCLKDKRWQDGAVGPVSLAVLCAEVLFSIVLTLAGTCTVVNRIVGHWRMYGGPFGCHCERMWSTCACSANHAGMEDCLVAGL